MIELRTKLIPSMRKDCHKQSLFKALTFLLDEDIGESLKNVKDSLQAYFLKIKKGT